MTARLAPTGSSDREFQYKTIFSRRQTISIIVSPDKGVIVKAPYRTPAKTIDCFVTEKSEWIRKALDKFSTLIRLDKPEGYSDGDTLLLFGKEHTLRLIRGNRYSVNLGRDNSIEVSWSDNNNPLLIREILEGWFSFVARQQLPGEFREVMLKHIDHGLNPTGFKVRKMKTRWGSCSSKGGIALSYDLIRLNRECREYVMVHELCHLRHHDHGKGFYDLLTDLYPGWKEIRAEIRRHIR